MKVIYFVPMITHYNQAKLCHLGANSIPNGILIEIAYCGALSIPKGNENVWLIFSNFNLEDFSFFSSIINVFCSRLLAPLASMIKPPQS
jgi:hypothetical protein